MFVTRSACAVWPRFDHKYPCSNSIECDRECASMRKHIFQSGNFQIADRLKFSRPRQSWPCVSARSTDDFIRFRIFAESLTLYYKFLLLLSAMVSHMTNRTHRTLRLCMDTLWYSTEHTHQYQYIENQLWFGCRLGVRNGISRSVHRVRCVHTNARHTNFVSHSVRSAEYMRNGALHGHTIAAPSPRFSHRIQTNNKMVYRSDRCRSEYSFVHSWFDDIDRKCCCHHIAHAINRQRGREKNEYMQNVATCGACTHCARHGRPRHSCVRKSQSEVNQVSMKERAHRTQAHDDAKLRHRPKRLPMHSSCLWTQCGYAKRRTPHIAQPHGRRQRQQKKQSDAKNVRTDNWRLMLWQFAR